MLALVDGRPIPFSFINSRKSSSSICLPQFHMANKVASVNWLGGFVSFPKEGWCGPFTYNLVVYQLLSLS
jgi:hypothetical protein